MVTLPHKYKGIFENMDCQIIGWNGLKLQTKIDGKVYTLRDKDKYMLLKSLNLKEEDIPGRPVIRTGIRGLHDMRIEEDDGEGTVS